MCLWIGWHCEKEKQTDAGGNKRNWGTVLVLVLVLVFIRNMIMKLVLCSISHSLWTLFTDQHPRVQRQEKQILFLTVYDLLP